MLYHWATRETPGAVGYPAFAPGSLEVAVGLLVFLYLAHNLSQLHMCVIIFINSLIISHYFVAWGINASTTAKGPRSQVPGCLTHSIRPQPSTRKPSEGWQLGPVHREPTKCTPPPRQGWLGSAPSGGKRTSTLTLHMSCLRSQTPRRHLGCTEASEGGLPREEQGARRLFTVELPHLMWEFLQDWDMRGAATKGQATAWPLSQEWPFSCLASRGQLTQNPPETQVWGRGTLHSGYSQSWGYLSHHDRGNSQRCGETEVPAEEYLRERTGDNLGEGNGNPLYISFSPLPLASLLFSAICKSSSDNDFAFLHLFFSGYKFVQRRGKNVTLVVCFLMQLKREIKKCLKLADYFLLLETPGLLACYPLTSNFTCWNPKLHRTSECDCIWRWHL